MSRKPVILGRGFTPSCGMNHGAFQKGIENKRRPPEMVISDSRRAMLITCVQNALQTAKYDLLKNGQFHGEIPGFHGVWAQTDNFETCHVELQSAREGRLILAFALDLNPPWFLVSTSFPFGHHAKWGHPYGCSHFCTFYDNTMAAIESEAANRSLFAATGWPGLWIKDVGYTATIRRRHCNP
jgi:hypothetical protein